MSVFLNNTTCLGTLGGNGFVVNYDDDRLAQYWWYSKFEWNISTRRLWPSTRMYGSDGRVSTAPMNSAPNIWDWKIWGDTDAGAGQRRNTITGITTGAGGPIASATVKLYRTLTDEVVDTVISNSVGSYVATSPYGSEAVYARGHITATTDLDGTTTQTLTPT